MKFKAEFSDRGLVLLEKRFVPALEKNGPHCLLYLTPTHVSLVHSVLSTDGVQVIAQLSKDAVFEEYHISSLYGNSIAFQVELPLLLRVLHSAAAVEWDQFAVRLTKKKATPAAERATPFLNFECRGARTATVQDLPVGNPLLRAELEELQRLVGAAQQVPSTLVQMPDLSQLQSVSDRLKNVGDVLRVAVFRSGGLHLRVYTSCVSIGTSYRNLRVLGVRSVPRLEAESPNPAAELDEALSAGEATAVDVGMKHFVKSLQCHLTAPEATYCGIADNGSCLTMMFQYFYPGTRQTDEGLSLYYRLPILDMES
eukprot:jgi/Chlat1/7236/Chrsp58S06890